MRTILLTAFHHFVVAITVQLSRNASIFVSSMGWVGGHYDPFHYPNS
jgi:hypothetical protein